MPAGRMGSIDQGIKQSSYPPNKDWKSIMAKHEKLVCQHGIIIRNCRCWSPDKVTRVVDCKDTCRPPVEIINPEDYDGQG